MLSDEPRQLKDPGFPQFSPVFCGFLAKKSLATPFGGPESEIRDDFWQKTAESRRIAFTKKNAPGAIPGAVFQVCFFNGLEEFSE